MDWEGTSCSPSVAADGLLFTNSRGTLCPADGTGPNSVSNGTLFSNDVQGLRVEKLNGTVFTPLEIDVAEYSRSVKDPHVEFVGHKADGTTVTVQAPLDGVADGPGGAPDFQTFTFPSSFANIVRLEVPTGRWSFDNFVFSTVAPPPLPADQRLEGAFRAPFNRFSRPLLQDQFIVGPGYSLNSGFRAAHETVIFQSGGSINLASTYSPYFANGSGELYFADYLRTGISSYKNGLSTIVATAQDTTGTGWPMTHVDLPRWVGGPVLFLGYDTSGSDQFGIFLKGAGPGVLALITPQTSLPGSSGTYFSTPHAFPTDIAVHPVGFAFDTTLTDFPDYRRIYASFFGGPPRHIVGENDSIPVAGWWPVVTVLKRFAFNADGDLEVDVTFDTGTARLYFDLNGLRKVVETTLTVSPVNAGKTVSGTLLPATLFRPALLTTADGEVYREKDGRYFRVVGIGDKIDGEIIQTLELKATPSYPERLVIEVRYASDSSNAHIVELELAEPVTHPPRFGALTVHPESGDWFIPLSHLTADKTYWLARSHDLQNWERLQRIDRIRPLQHVFIPAEQTQAPKIFFRVEEE